MKTAKRYKPQGISDEEINHAIRELKGHASFNRFCEAIYNMREMSLTRMWHDDVIANDRVSLAYQVEARVYQDILNRIADAGTFREQTEEA